MWSSWFGERLSAIGVYWIVVDTTRRESGRRATPNEARRAPGNTSVSLPGAEVHDVQKLLHHAGPHTSHIYVTQLSDQGSRILAQITGC